MMCLEHDDVTPAIIADHVIPHKGDEELFWHGALQSLCEPCHNKWKQIEERNPGRGCDANGIPYSRGDWG